MNWPNPLCVIIQKEIFKSKSNKTENCSVRKTQFEKWSYDHNRKGPSQHELQHQSSYKSVGTLSSAAADLPLTSPDSYTKR